MLPVQSLKVSCWDGIFEAPVAAVALPHASLTMVIELGSGSTVVESTGVLHHVMIDPLEDCYGFSEGLHEGVSGSGREVCF